MSIFYELIKSWLCFDTTTTFIARIREKSPFISCIIDEAIKGHLRRYELDKQSNRWWTGAISDYYHEKEALETAETLDKVIKSVTKEDIKKLAINTFDNKYIEASLMPKK